MLTVTVALVLADPIRSTTPGTERLVYWFTGFAEYTDVSPLTEAVRLLPISSNWSADT